jgi:integrase/recombinase XerD
MPAHHNLNRYLEEYTAAVSIAQDRKGSLFRSTNRRSGELTGSPLLPPGGG